MCVTERRIEHTALDPPVVAFGMEEADSIIKYGDRFAPANVEGPLPHDLEHCLVPAYNDVASAEHGALTHPVITTILVEPRLKLADKILGRAHLNQVAKQRQTSRYASKAYMLSAPTADEEREEQEEGEEREEAE